MRQLALVVLEKRLPDLDAGLESFCRYADQARDADPDAKPIRVWSQWVTTTPEARVVIQTAHMLLYVMATKAREEEELVAAVEARKLAKGLGRVRTASRWVGKKLLDAGHDDAAGGAASMAQATAAVAEVRRCLIAPLVAFDDETARAMDALGALFLTINPGIGKKGRPSRLDQPGRVWLLAEAGIPRGAIRGFEGLSEDALASILTRVRRGLRPQGEQPRPSPGAGQPQPSR
jgi:hypothetical protein